MRPGSISPRLRGGGLGWLGPDPKVVQLETRTQVQGDLFRLVWLGSPQSKHAAMAEADVNAHTHLDMFTAMELLLGFWCRTERLGGPESCWKRIRLTTQHNIP